MARNLVLCCDGTWNTPELETVTNVVKIYNALLKDGQQRVHYQTGVGTSGGPLKFLAGGIAGVGLSTNVMNAYYWLATHFEPGDRIWLFGFSRGAYTARSVAGMIGSCGLLHGEDPANVTRHLEQVYRHYRDDSAPLPAADYSYRAGSSAAHPVHFVGVWDTVGALGVPDYLGLLNVLDKPEAYAFHDLKLHPGVAHARHALALDETRAPFSPTLWDEAAADRDRIKQVWFPGSHCDVGGGYAQSGLSDGALRWMIEEARKLGLRFDHHVFEEIRPEPRAPIHDDTRAALAAIAPFYTIIEPIIDRFFEPMPRAVPEISRANEWDGQYGCIHESVFVRIEPPFLNSGAYRPQQHIQDARPVTVEANQDFNATGLYLTPGTYRFQGRGLWRDCDRDWCDPDGYERSSVFSKVLSTFEKWLQRVPGAERANVAYTRRVEGAPWLKLIGLIANDSIRPHEASYPVHETFEIGSSATHTVRAPGYLYAFANDARGAYNDNLGSVELTVRRID